MKCGACGKSGLRATTLALVPSEDGAGLERRRVCGDCAGGALVLVLRPATPECLVCREPAVVCRAHGGISPGETSAARRRAAKKIRALALGYRAAPRGDSTDASYVAGRAAGLEQAADVLDAEDFGR